MNGTVGSRNLAEQKGSEALFPPSRLSSKNPKIFYADDALLLDGTQVNTLNMAQDGNHLEDLKMVYFVPML